MFEVLRLDAPGPALDTAGAVGDGDGFCHAVAGDLTFHGVTQSLDGQIDVGRIDESAVRIRGEHVIDVRSWKINPPRLGLIKVHPDVRVRIDIVARS